MTDKELLELSAKAAELPECGWMGPAFMYVKDNRFTDWNPLTDDGDALRLAVKLDLAVMPYPLFDKPKHSLVVSLRSLEDSRFEVVELHNGDPYAATRRAIVRAAAEIGKTL